MIIKKRENKYTVKEVLEYFKKNNILLVNADETGEVILPEISSEFILDDDADNSIVG